MNRLEGQTGGICVQSVLAKWCCGCLSTLLEMELRELGKRDKSLEDVHIFGFEEGRSMTEIFMAIRLMAAAAREWCPELGFIACSLHVKQAFVNVSPLNLSLVMKEMNIDPTLAGALLRERIGSKYDVCFPEMRVSSISCDKSMKQGGKESPSFFNLMMKAARRMEKSGDWSEAERK